MVQLLYSNAATLATTLGGGQHGHIGIIMPAALYTTLSGAVPIHAANATTAVRETERLNHKAAQKIFINHNNMNDALRTQVYQRRHGHVPWQIKKHIHWIFGSNTKRPN
jgi:hypothetical protein